MNPPPMDMKQGSSVEPRYRRQIILRAGIAATTVFVCGVVYLNLKVSANDATRGSWEAAYDCRPWMISEQAGCRRACDEAAIPEACEWYGLHAANEPEARRADYLRHACHLGKRPRACAKLSEWTAGDGG